MLIKREWLGGSEVIDLEADNGYFVNDVVQDEEVAEELINRIVAEKEVTVNMDDPEYIERYTVVG